MSRFEREVVLKRKSVVCMVMFILLFVVSGCAGSPTTQEPRVFETPAHWTVQKDGKSMYMLGTIHIGKESMYPLHPMIEEALATSTHLAVEIDIADPEKVKQHQTAIASLGLKGEKAEPEVTPELQEKLKEKLKTYGISSLHEHYRFWYLCFLVSQFQTQAFIAPSLSSNHGVDRYLLKQFRDKGSIVEIETVEEQMQPLIDWAKQDPQNYYSMFLDGKGQPNDIKKLLNLWSQGDMTKLQQYILPEVSEKDPMYPFYDGMFFKRNASMVSKIEGYFKQDGVYFVAVEAGHFLGEKGIVSLLKKKGYQVKRVDLK